MLKFTKAETEAIETAINFLLTYSVMKINIPGRAESFCIILDL